MRGKKRSHIRYLCAALMAGTALSGCLPGEVTQRETISQSRLESQARARASAIAEYAVYAQNSISQSETWKAGTLEQGSISALIGAHQDFDSAYCIDGDNHLLLSWFKHDGEFALKGMGSGAGPQILRQLHKIVSADTAGIFDAGQIVLGSTTLAVPEGCGASIPQGAPAMVFQQMSAPEPDAVVVSSYEYQTKDCADGQVGGITQRRLTKFDPLTGTKTAAGDYEIFQDSCTGAVDRQTINVTAGISNAIDVSALSDGTDVAAILSQLADIDCKTASGESAAEPESYATSEIYADGQSSFTGPDVLPQPGPGENDANESGVNVSTCYTDGVTVKKFRGVQAAGFTGGIDEVMTLGKDCGAGDLGLFAASYNGFGGTANPGVGWQGTVTYRRDVVDVYADTGDTGLSSDSGHRMTWAGDSIDCRRAETMNVECYTVLPQFQGAAYSAVNLSGYDFSRTNIIDKWASRFAFKPAAPMPPNQGWNPDAVGCEWLESNSFQNCPASFTPSNTGEEERDIAGALPVGGFNQSAWRSVNASTCENTTVSTSTSDCGAGISGSVTTTVTTVYTSTAPFSFSAPSITSSSSSSASDNCVALAPVPAPGSPPATPTVTTATVDPGDPGFDPNAVPGATTVTNPDGSTTTTTTTVNPDGSVTTTVATAPPPVTSGSGDSSDSSSSSPAPSYTVEVGTFGGGSFSQNFDNLADAQNYANQYGSGSFTGGPSITDNNTGQGVVVDRPAPATKPTPQTNPSNTNDEPSKVLCTYFYRKGMIPEEIYAADVAYSQTRVSQRVRRGYHAWAVPLVRYLQTHEAGLVERVAFVFVSAWAEEMAAVMQPGHASNPLGRLMRIAGEPLCGFIGQFATKTDYKALWCAH